MLYLPFFFSVLGWVGGIIMTLTFGFITWRVHLLAANDVAADAAGAAAAAAAAALGGKHCRPACFCLPASVRRYTSRLLADAMVVDGVRYRTYQCEFLTVQ